MKKVCPTAAAASTTNTVAAHNTTRANTVAAIRTALPQQALIEVQTAGKGCCLAPLAVPLPLMDDVVSVRKSTVAAAAAAAAVVLPVEAILSTK